MANLRVKPFSKYAGIEIVSDEPESVIVSATLDVIVDFAEAHNLRHFQPRENSPSDRLLRVMLMHGKKVHCSAHLDRLKNATYGLFLRGGNPRDLKQYRGELLNYF